MKWKRILGYIVGLIIIGFLINILVNQWSQIKEYSWEFNIGWLALSILFLSISPFILALTSITVLERLNERITFLKTFNILNISTLIRYIPGNIWYIAGRVELFNKHKISRLASGISIFLEIAISLLAASSIFLFALLLGYDLLQISSFWVIPIIILIFIGMQPKIFNTCLNKIYKVIRKKDLQLNWKYENTLELYLLLLTHWIIQGLAFFFLVKSIYPTSYVSLIPFIGIYAIAWVLSFLTFISPGGLGIKEGIMVLFLQSFMPVDVAIVISLFSRIVTILHETLIGGISIILRKLEQ